MCMLTQRDLIAGCTDDSTPEVPDYPCGSVDGTAGESRDEPDGGSSSGEWHMPATQMSVLIALI